MTRPRYNRNKSTATVVAAKKGNGCVDKSTKSILDKESAKQIELFEKLTGVSRKQWDYNLHYQASQQEGLTKKHARWLLKNFKQREGTRTT